jgi:hypothetical protein
MPIVIINSEVSLSNTSGYIRFEHFMLLAIIEFLECSSSPAAGWTTVISKTKNYIYYGTK